MHKVILNLENMENLSKKELFAIKGGEKDLPKGFWYWDGTKWVWMEINDIDPIPEIM